MACPKCSVIAGSGRRGDRFPADRDTEEWCGSSSLGPSLRAGSSEHATESQLRASRDPTLHTSRSPGC